MVAETPELDFKERLERCIQTFAASPLEANREMMRLLQSSAEDFAAAGEELLARAGPAPGYRRLLHLMLEAGFLLRAVTDEERITLAQAVELVRRASRLDPLMDAKILRHLLAGFQNNSEEEEERLVRRLLAVYSAAGFGARLLPMLIQLLRTKDVQVRSKAALIIGRCNRQVSWALEDSDPRVRANGVEALWGVDSRAARATLWKYARDPNNRVAGNAIAGLLMVGDLGAEQQLARMATHDSLLFRATAAWVIGRAVATRHLDLLKKLLADSEEPVRQAAARAMRVFPEPEVEPSLAALHEAIQQHEAPPPADQSRAEEAPPPERKDGADAAEQEQEPAGRYCPIRGLQLG